MTYKWVAFFIGILLFHACSKHDEETHLEQTTPSGTSTTVQTDIRSNFLLLLDTATIEANDQAVFPAFYEINGIPHECIYQHPPAKIYFEDVFVGENASLQFKIGIREECWQEEGDGVTFIIKTVSEQGEEDTIFHQYINPKENEDERQWLSQEIALDEFENTSTTFIFETLPSEENSEPNNNFDWAVWGNPVLQSDGRDDTHTSHDKTNVILITVDTLRSDYLSCYGNPWVETDTIDFLANHGVLFENVFATMPTTTPSHASILTSLYPYEHGAINNDYHLAERIPRLPELMNENGYTTGAAISVFHMDDVMSGLGKGFDTYQQVNPEWQKEKGINNISALTRTAGVTTDAAINWLEEVHNQPYFLWVHYYDPHAPYHAEGDLHQMYYDDNPVAEEHTSMDNAIFNVNWQGQILDWAQQFRDLDYYRKEYGAEATYVDDQISDLMDALKRLQVDDNTMIVFTADHGENLGEHDVYFDHWFMYDNDLRVPLIFYYPKKVTQGIRVDHPISQIDIAPTILDIIGDSDNFVAKHCFEGQSLRPIWENQSWGTSPILHAEGLLYTEMAAWDDAYKVIWQLRDTIYHEKAQLKADRLLVYDLIRDPEESQPVASFIWDKSEEITEQEVSPYQTSSATEELDKAKLVERTKLFASKKIVPDEEELQSWFEIDDEDHFIRTSALEDETFIPRLIDMLEELKKRVDPPHVVERIEKLGDISTLQAVEYESVPINDPAFEEMLKSLGYASD